MVTVPELNKSRKRRVFCNIPVSKKEENSFHVAFPFYYGTSFPFVAK